MSKKEYAAQIAAIINGEVQEAEKANGVIYTGVLVKGSGNAAPLIYIDTMYNDGLTVQEAADKITNEILPGTKSSIDMDFFMDFEQVKPRLRARLYNKATKAEVFRPAGEPFDDLIIVPYVEVGNIHGVAAIKVKKEHVDVWNVTPDEVIDIAEQNAKKEAQIMSMADVMRMMGAPEAMIQDDDQIFVISNTSKCCGAYSVIAMLDELKSKFGSFAILPSSIHEVLLVTIQENEKGQFDDMVTSVNDNELTPEDVLSNHAYFIAA